MNYHDNMHIQLNMTFFCQTLYETEIETVQHKEKSTYMYTCAMYVCYYYKNKSKQSLELGGVWLKEGMSSYWAVKFLRVLRR